MLAALKTQAMNLLERDQDIHTLQELLGHSDLKTTMIYTHVLNRAPGRSQPRRPALSCVTLRTMGYRIRIQSRLPDGHPQDTRPAEGLHQQATFGQG